MLHWVSFTHTHTQKKTLMPSMLSLQLKVALTAAQFKAILALCIEGVEPRWSEEKVNKEVESAGTEKKVMNKIGQDVKSVNDDTERFAINEGDDDDWREDDGTHF